MTRIFVNGVSAKSGGGRSILRNFLCVARDADDDFEFVVAVGNSDGLRDLGCGRIVLVETGLWSTTALIPWASLFALPRLALRTGCSAIFNLGDVPIRSPLPQVLLFDWPYAAYPRSRAWGLSAPHEWLARKAKLWLFRHLRSNIDLMVAQNAPLAHRLQTIYDLPNVEIIPNAVSIENFDGGEFRDFALGEGFKLLCLSRYYSHKNIEIFLPLARIIRKKGINAKIITTLERDENIGAKHFLDAIEAEGLSDVILNVGSVPMSQVPSLYQQTDALLLPTYLESFSGTYVEAMHHGLPILTSDLDFARGVCGEAALYFDPSDEATIFNAICQLIDHPELCETKVAIGKAILSELPSWPAAYGLFTRAFRKALGR